QHPYITFAPTRRSSDLAKEIARRSIPLLKNDGVVPPSGPRLKRILTVVAGDIENYRTEIQRPGSPWPNEPVGDYLTLQLRKRYRSEEHTSELQSPEHLV